MKISFVIPARNEEGYIREALRSLLAQPQELVKEIIVVNNGSTDRTVELVKTFPSVRLLEQPIPGLPKTREVGFRSATGEIIASIDADTILPNHWAEAVIHAFEKNGRVSAVSGPYFYSETNVLQKFLNYFLILTLYFPTHLMLNFLGISGIILGGNFAVRRRVFEKAKPFLSQGTFYGEDAYMAKQFRLYGPIKFMMKLSVLTSPRRFKSEGFFKVMGLYIVNFLWVNVTGKPYSR